MREGAVLRAVTLFLLLVMVVAPVQASFEDMLLEYIANRAKPQWQYTAGDYVRDGNLYKARCEKASSLYDEQLRAYVRQEALAQNPAADMSAVLDKLQNPTAQQRVYVMSTGFHQKDPQAQTYWDVMIESCTKAEQNYNAALALTPEDDYEQQAEIFNEGAGIYDALGQTEEAEQVRDAAAVAEAHAAASSFDLPLPGWLAIFGVLGGLFILNRRKN